MTARDTARRGALRDDLATQLERAYAGSEELTLAQMRQILEGLGALRTTAAGINTAAVAALLARCGAGRLSVDSVDLLVRAVNELKGDDPVQHIPLKRLEDLMSQIN